VNEKYYFSSVTLCKGHNIAENKHNTVNIDGWGTYLDCMATMSGAILPIDIQVHQPVNKKEKEIK